RAGRDGDPIAPVAAELDEILEPLVEPAERRALYTAISERVRDARPERFRIPAVDGWAAIGVFWLVFFSSIPAILPFLILSEPWLAMRVSNGLLLGLLFFLGYRWGRVTSASPWWA